jgi:MFS family permease
VDWNKERRRVTIPFISIGDRAPAHATAATSPASQSLRAFDAVNFCLAAMLAGFGPFVAVFLGERDWSLREIGFVLSAGFIAALVVQLPAGELLDATQSKRLLLALATGALATAALIIALWPTFAAVLVALVLQGATGGFVGAALAATSLGLVGHAALAERLGRNQAFKSAGSLAAAGLLGVVGYFLSGPGIFFATAALAVPTLIAIAGIRAADIHFGRSVGAPEEDTPRRPPRATRRSVSKHRQLLVFAACLFLFQLADASILPLLGGTLAHSAGHRSLPIIAVLVVVPQILVAVLSPWVGRTAERRGRRPLLLVGFAVLPVRALVFSLSSDPLLLTAAQMLDGISGMALGVLTPLIIADLTMGSGRYNLAQGMVGMISGLGAALSTTMAGVVASAFGPMAAYIAVVVVALAGTIGLWLFMPETKPAHKR